MAVSLIPAGWSVDEGDPDVGIFGTQFVHEDCPKEYDQGCVHDSGLEGKIDAQGYVNEVYTVVCMDCEAKMTFTDKAFVGRDEFPPSCYEEN